MVSQRVSSELQEAKEHFELIFNTVPEATIITRLDNPLIMDVNDGFIEITGFKR
jgi:PAS domain S-box-containing protein